MLNVPIDEPAAPSKTQVFRAGIGGFLLLIGLLQLGHRGTQRLRNDIPLWDFVSVHSATRTWLHGGDPYDLPAVIRNWHESGIFTDRDTSYFATVYLPCSLVMVAPLAMLPAGVAMVVWLSLTILLLGLQFIALADMARLGWRDTRALIMVGAIVASAPFQFGVLSGQLSMPAISLCILAFWCAGRQKELVGGVMLGLACGLKPQLGGLFVLYYLATRRMKLAGIAALVVGLICLGALAGMYLSHVSWLEGWQRSVAETTRIGGVNDYGWTGEFRDEIVDLKMLLISAVHDGTAIRLLVLAGMAALFAWYARVFLPARQRDPGSDLLLLGGLSGLVLLCVYHRVYDVMLMTLALSWAISELDGAWRKQALATIIPMLVFLVPFDVVRTIGKRSATVMELSQTAWWQSLVAPHYAWGLLAVTITTLAILTQWNRRASQLCVTPSPSPDAGCYPGR